MVGLSIRLTERALISLEVRKLKSTPAMASEMGVEIFMATPARYTLLSEKGQEHEEGKVKVRKRRRDAQVEKISEINFFWNARLVEILAAWRRGRE